MKLFMQVLLILLGCILSVVAWAQRSPGPSAVDWLDKMAVAVETLDYRGTLVQIRDGHMRSFEVIRRVDDMGIRERMYALDGPPQEMIRYGEQFRSSFQGAPIDGFRFMEPRLMPHQPLNQLAKLSSAYDLFLGGIERVAGYDAQRIDIQPKDQYRYGQQLWLERRTGMLLRSAVISADGQRLAEQVFVSIDLGASISDTDLEPSTAAVTDVADQGRWMRDRSAGSPGEVTSLMRRSGLLRSMWAPKQVPAHFKLVNANHGRSDMDSAFDHLLFSDGLTSFSVYIDHAPVRSVPTQVDSLGTLHVFTGMMGRRQFTIMGQVPRQTIVFVGQQLLESSGAYER